LLFVAPLIAADKDDATVHGWISSLNFIGAILVAAALVWRVGRAVFSIALAVLALGLSFAAQSLAGTLGAGGGLRYVAAAITYGLVGISGYLLRRRYAWSVPADLERRMETALAAIGLLALAEASLLDERSFRVQPVQLSRANLRPRRRAPTRAALGYG
jgi:hypothetical protein